MLVATIGRRRVAHSRAVLPPHPFPPCPARESAPTSMPAMIAQVDTIAKCPFIARSALLLPHPHTPPFMAPHSHQPKKHGNRETPSPLLHRSFGRTGSSDSGGNSRKCDTGCPKQRPILISLKQLGKTGRRGSPAFQDERSTIEPAVPRTRGVAGGPQSVSQPANRGSCPPRVGRAGVPVNAVGDGQECPSMRSGTGRSARPTSDCGRRCVRFRALRWRGGDWRHTAAGSRR